MRNLAAIIFSVFFFFSGSAFSADAPAYQFLPPLPEPLGGFAAAYDADGHRTIVFGGTTFGGQHGTSTYISNGGPWAILPANNGPSPRTGHVMTGLPKSGVLLFGGIDSGGQYLNDTWILKGDEWSRIDASPRPSARSSAAMICDRARGEAVLFGGYNPQDGDLKDTWIFKAGKWRKTAPPQFPPARSAASLVFLEKPGVGILFGGYGPQESDESRLADLSDVWSWDGVAWKKLKAEPSPPPRSNARSAYDPKASSVYFFGGFSDEVSYQDLWRFDGKRFEQIDEPGLKYFYADIQFVENADEGKIQVVPNVGTANPETAALEQLWASDPKGLMGDTWIFDGKKWTLMKSETSPSARAYSASAYDPGRKVLVLFGGSNAEKVLRDDTWEYDGKTWKKIATEHIPPARFDHAMVYDENLRLVLLFGGFGKDQAGETCFGDTWAFDGKDWRQLAFSSSPPARSRHLLVYDRSLSGTLAGYGTGQQGSDLGDLWLLKDGVWKPYDPPGSSPPARSSVCVADVPGLGGDVLFGGRDAVTGNPAADTWVLRQGKWEETASAGGPQARYDGALTPSADGRAVWLFGGYNGQRDLGDLWSFDGTAWTRMTAEGGPSSRSYFTFTQGEAFGGAVLFGGYSATGTSQAEGPGASASLMGTWEFDGKRWTQLETKTRPEAQISYSFCFDEKREVGVLFGGYSEKLGELGETWEFDGKDWKNVATADHPRPRTSVNLVYDRKRDAVLLYGGYSQETGALNDMWTYDGKNWKKLAIDAPYSNYTGGTNMIFNSGKKVFWLYGGRPSR